MITDMQVVFRQSSRIWEVVKILTRAELARA
jgi:hypothetical protein